MNTDDLIDLPHLVIVENENQLQMLEFERGADGQAEAHLTAEQIASRGFQGRVIVAARYRCITSYDYDKQYRDRMPA